MNIYKKFYKNKINYQSKFDFFCFFFSFVNLTNNRLDEEEEESADKQVDFDLFPKPPKESVKIAAPPLGAEPVFKTKSIPKKSPTPKRHNNTNNHNDNNDDDNKSIDSFASDFAPKERVIYLNQGDSNQT